MAGGEARRRRWPPSAADGKFELIKDHSQRFEPRQPWLPVGGDRLAQQTKSASGSSSSLSFEGASCRQRVTTSHRNHPFIDSGLWRFDRKAQPNFRTPSPACHGISPNRLEWNTRFSRAPPEPSSAVYGRYPAAELACEIRDDALPVTLASSFAAQPAVEQGLRADHEDDAPKPAATHAADAR